MIKPIEEKDKKNNDQIKEDLVRELDKVRNKLRIREIRQMKNKRLIIEVKDNEDVDIIKNANLRNIGLKTDKPSKINPSIIIYDVEQGNKVNKMQEDFINKNLEFLEIEELDSLKKEIAFRHRYKTSNNKMNWIVQVPGKLFENLIDRRRVYMMWRSYKIKEYLNIVRCYKCHGFGHIAKVCTNADRLCECCRSNEHVRENCPENNTPKCVNCMRNRRRDVSHSVRSKDCPEYRRQVEIYRNKTKW